MNFFFRIFLKKTLYKMNLFFFDSRQIYENLFESRLVDSVTSNDASFLRGLKFFEESRQLNSSRGPE